MARLVRRMGASSPMGMRGEAVSQQGFQVPESGFFGKEFTLDDAGKLVQTGRQATMLAKEALGTPANWLAKKLDENKAEAAKKKLMQLQAGGGAKGPQGPTGQQGVINVGDIKPGTTVTVTAAPEAVTPLAAPQGMQPSGPLQETRRQAWERTQATILASQRAQAAAGATPIKYPTPVSDMQGFTGRAMPDPDDTADVSRSMQPRVLPQHYRTPVATVPAPVAAPPAPAVARAPAPPPRQVPRAVEAARRMQARPAAGGMQPSGGGLLQYPMSEELRAGLQQMAKDHPELRGALMGIGMPRYTPARAAQVLPPQEQMELMDPYQLDRFRSLVKTTEDANRFTRAMNMAIDRVPSGFLGKYDKREELRRHFSKPFDFLPYLAPKRVAEPDAMKLLGETRKHAAKKFYKGRYKGDKPGRPTGGSRRSKRLFEGLMLRKDRVELELPGGQMGTAEKATETEGYVAWGRKSPKARARLLKDKAAMDDFFATFYPSWKGESDKAKKGALRGFARTKQSVVNKEKRDFNRASGVSGATIGRVARGKVTADIAREKMTLKESLAEEKRVHTVLLAKTQARVKLKAQTKLGSDRFNVNRSKEAGKRGRLAHDSELKDLETALTKSDRDEVRLQARVAYSIAYEEHMNTGLYPADRTDEPTGEPTRKKMSEGTLDGFGDLKGD